MFDIEPGSNYYCSDLQFKYLISLIETDCFCRAYNLTDLAFSFNIIGTMLFIYYRFGTAWGKGT
jgi:hypothetical protein